jgi:hypothetical protein
MEREIFKNYNKAQLKQTKTQALKHGRYNQGRDEEHMRYLMIKLDHLILDSLHLSPSSLSLS